MEDTARLMVLHLSDIHLKENGDIQEFAEIIASGCYTQFRASDACLIVVTGDIAFSGKVSEYERAEPFLDEIKTHLGRENSEAPVYIILVPGNHDCQLVTSNATRSAVIEQVVSNRSLAEDDSVVNLCTAVQDDYFLFRDMVTTLSPVYDNKLWTEYAFEINGRLIRISAINAAWMSRIPETQGTLVFPIDRFTKIAGDEAALRIALLHHPLNWYSQVSYHPLKKLLRSSSHAILTGHEHVAASGRVIDTSDGNSLYFESPALCPHDVTEDSGFSCLVFDLIESTVTQKRYLLVNNKLRQDGEDVVQPLDMAVGYGDDLSRLTSEMVAHLSDPGGKFTHPEKGELLAEDIFVYPELEERSSEERKVAMANDLPIKEHGQRILLLGDDKSGKSFLLKRYYIDLLAAGKVPILIRGCDVKNTSDSSIEKVMRRAVGEQYRDPDIFQYAEKQNRIVLLDDIDRQPQGSREKGKLVSYLEKQFSTLILTGSIGMELGELVDRDVADTLLQYSTYEIRNFGHLMRLKLIRKWHMCGHVDTHRQLDLMVHSTETLIDNVIGKNLVPSYPIYLLILLQSTNSQKQDELISSGLSYYYQFLITKSFAQSGAPLEAFDEIFSYVSQLAWFCSNLYSKEWDKTGFRKFNDAFSHEYASVDLDSRVDLLIRSKILTYNAGYYSFLYPYVYYFFLGKYLAANLDDEEIMSLVRNYCANLEDKNNASTVLFLSHHANEPWVIDEIQKAADSCFEGVSPVSIDSDVRSLCSLVDSTSQLVINDLNVDRNQVQHRRFRDELEEAEHQQPDLEGEALQIITKINRLIRTADILGHITKNYYGSTKRERKESYIRSVFDGLLRLLRSIFDDVLGDPELFVQELERIMTERGKSSDEQIRERAKKVAFDLIGLICTGIIARAAQCVTADVLREDITKVVDCNGSNAYRLIGYATTLLKPGGLPFTELKKFAAELKGNVFAFTILQSLIAYHLHMFHTTEKDKQRLCEIADISMLTARAMEIRGNRGRAEPK